MKHYSAQIRLETTEKGLFWRYERRFVYKQDTKTFPKCYAGIGMASKISKTTYKCVDRLRHNGIKGAKAKCAH